jgi:hypothetical protein
MTTPPISIPVHVAHEHVEAFIAATLKFVQPAIRDARLYKCVVYQRADDPTYFILELGYQSPTGQVGHKEFRDWETATAGMMSSSRTVGRSPGDYNQIFPRFIPSVMRVSPLRDSSDLQDLIGSIKPPQATAVTEQPRPSLPIQRKKWWQFWK